MLYEGKRSDRIVKKKSLGELVVLCRRIAYALSLRSGSGNQR